VEEGIEVDPLSASRCRPVFQLPLLLSEPLLEGIVRKSKISEGAFTHITLPFFLFPSFSVKTGGREKLFKFVTEKRRKSVIGEYFFPSRPRGKNERGGTETTRKTMSERGKRSESKSRRIVRTGGGSLFPSR
jgi:hypothetical protein